MSALEPTVPETKFCINSCKRKPGTLVRLHSAGGHLALTWRPHGPNGHTHSKTRSADTSRVSPGVGSFHEPLLRSFPEAQTECRVGD